MTPDKVQAEWDDLTAEHPMLRDIPMCILWPFTDADVAKWGKLTPISMPQDSILTVKFLHSHMCIKTWACVGYSGKVYYL